MCAKHDISEATCYAWKRKYGGMDVSEARRPGSLREENIRLKRPVAVQAVRELLGHKDVYTTMIYVHVINKPGPAVRSPLD